MTQEKNVYRIFLSNQMETETCAMVGKVVMKSWQNSSVKKCQYFYERGGAHEETHSKIIQNLAAWDPLVLNFPFIKSRGVLLF